MPIRTAFAVALLTLAASAAAQTFALGELPCLPTGENGVLTATIAPPPAAEVRVRLFFRRQNLMVEDFYFTEMVATGGGVYWGTFPQPEPSKFPPKKLRGAEDEAEAWAEWWRTKEASEDRDPNPDLDRAVIEERASVGKREKRDWLAAQDDAALQQFLARQSSEPAEYFVALYDPQGQRLAASPMQVVPVRDDCRVALTPQQTGLATNLTVGETARWQVGQPVFHWECTGVVTRLDRSGVLRPDEACRACVVAWWPAAAAAGALGSLVAIIDDDPRDPGEVSPSRP